MNIWKMISHHETPDLALSWSRRNRRIAIGWGKIGDLRAHALQSEQDIRTLIHESYPELKNAHNGGPSLWNLYQEVQRGDLVILSGSRPREIVLEVVGDYEFVDKRPDVNGRELSAEYFHQRRVDWTDWNADALWKLAGGAAKGQGLYLTLVRCANVLEPSQSPA